MSSISSQRVLIVGYGAVFHIGAHFLEAAHQLGHYADLFDATTAYEAHSALKHLNWRMRGHRPTHLDTFSSKLLEYCSAYQPHSVVVTGITPPNAHALTVLSDTGIQCVNYLTDDPWNPKHSSPWFLDALPHYAHVFSPRQSNLDDLTNLGCIVSYLPFAYNPTLHFHEVPPPERAVEFECDILFYGGADEDRVPYIKSLIDAGFKVHLYGGYWDRYPKTRSVWRGMANAQTLRWAVASAKVTLCLVRHANRDGHVMRTFEASAMGACLLAEDTSEHRTILGENALYFSSIENLVEGANILIHQSEKRLELSDNARARIVSNHNTYLDRFRTILAKMKEP